MKISTAKRNPVKGTKTFYVQSENDARKRYTVQRVTRERKATFFCNCADFMYRKLPHLDTNTFSGCKHIKAVRRAA
jgi:hypothetical protein